MAEKAKRSARTHAGQFELYVGYITEHEQLRTGAVKMAKLWEILQAQLNAYGAGPQKTAEGWQSFFMNWKHRLRRKARVIKMYGNGTGGGPATDKKLTDLEEGALSLWGREAIDGNGVGAVGFGPCVPAFESVDVLDVDIEMPDTPKRMEATTPLNAIPKSTAKKTTIRTSHKKQIAKMMKESDDAIAASISRLAEFRLS